jgi:hypothetical protein
LQISRVALNLRRSKSDISKGRDFDHSFGELDMTKAAHVSAPISASTASSEKLKKSESHPLVSISLFCGIGLLVSLVAILLGVQGVWY